MFNKDLNAVRIIYSQRVQEEAEFGMLDARGWGVEGEVPFQGRVCFTPIVFIDCSLCIHDISKKSKHSLLT